MSAVRLTLLTLLAMRRRLLMLVAFAVAFLVTAAAARVLTGSHDGHIELDRLFAIGGAPLASGFLLLGWALGRFPLLAVLVLMAGCFSHDRTVGYARLYYARPVSPVRIYGLRFLVLTSIAFTLSALLMPTFDVILLGQWAGPTTLVLIAAYVITYGSVAALLSVWTRADAWIALLLSVLAIVWHALRTGGALEGTPPGIREVVTLVLPPHGALFRLESAFAAVSPVPWDAFVYVCLYAALLLVLGGISVVVREI